MPEAYPGSCLCGTVRFEASAFRDDAAHCHCSMCRKFHGAAFATFVSVPRSRFRWLEGEDALASYEAGNGTTRRFCRHCGSSLSFEAAGASDDIELALGAFDGEVPVVPDAHIFVASGARWAAPADGLPHFAYGRDGETVEDGGA